MAVLGKIRSKGVILICVIGIALFAFIAEEFFRSCDSVSNERRAQVGEVLGDKVNVQDFQKLVDEYTNVIRMTQGRDNLTDEEMNQVKDVVWNTFVQNEIINHEAEELGLKVTDQELQNVLNAGTNPMLLQTPFVNRQTGRFDANMLKQFLAEYKQAQGTSAQLLQTNTVTFTIFGHLLKSLCVSNCWYKSIRPCSQDACSLIPYLQRWLIMTRIRRTTFSFCSLCLYLR